MIQPRAGLYAVYEPPEEGWQDYPSQLNQIAAELEMGGLEACTAPAPVRDALSCERVAAWLAAQSLDLLYALIASWSFDHYTVRIQQAARLPVAIRAVPGIRTGSIVGAHQLQSVLYDLGVEHGLFYGGPDSPETARQIAVFARACALQKRLVGAKIAVIGRRTEGMTPTAVDEMEILPDLFHPALDLDGDRVLCRRAGGTGGIGYDRRLFTAGGVLPDQRANRRSGAGSHRHPQLHLLLE